jgi:hypothetical protein
MPGLNGAGPRGMGPMGGRGRGMCMSDDRAVVERFARQAAGLGLTFARGLGRDFGRRRLQGRMMRGGVDV